MAMAYSVFRLASWIPTTGRTRIDLLTSRAWSNAKSHFSASYQLSADHPSAKALEKMPYPTTPLDRSIFEDYSEEYALVDPKSNSPVMTSPDMLLSMVKAGRYAAAESLRLDLVQLGVTIPPCYAYEMAAKNALRSSFKGDRLEAFTNWFSLLPDAKHRMRKFKGLRLRLLAMPQIPELDIIMRFGLIAASKGHTKYITTPVISTVVHYADPSVSAQYLQDFEEEAMKWTRGKGAYIVREIHNLAVRTHASAGRLEESVRLLQAAQSRGINFQDYTYRMLIQHLKEVRDDTRLNIVLGLTPPHVTSEPLQPVTSLEQWKEAENSSLVSRLRLLRNSIKHESNITIPHTFLAHFIRDYSTTGRERALLLLRKRIFRYRSTFAPNWALAEMLYHRDRNENRLILIAFKRYFNIVGVPRKFLTFYIRELAPYRVAQPNPTSKANRKLVLMHRTPEPHIWSTKWLPRYRMWPAQCHTALVWGALVWLSSHTDSETLYQHLLVQARQSRPKPPTVEDGLSVPSPLVDENAITQTSSLAVDGAHFTPFLLAFSKRMPSHQAPERIAQVFADMMELGMKPTIEHWTILAGAFARSKDPDRAIKILDSMEAVDGRRNNEDGSLAGSDSDRFPPVTIVAYTSVLRAFIQAGRLDYALDIERRMRTRLHYVDGQRPRTDNVLLMLRKLKAEQENISTPPRRFISPQTRSTPLSTRQRQRSSRKTK